MRFQGELAMKYAMENFETMNEKLQIVATKGLDEPTSAKKRKSKSKIKAVAALGRKKGYRAAQKTKQWTAASLAKAGLWMTAAMAAVFGFLDGILLESLLAAVVAVGSFFIAAVMLLGSSMVGAIVFAAVVVFSAFYYLSTAKV
jgi:hypothetical protein